MKTHDDGNQTAMPDFRLRPTILGLAMTAVVFMAPTAGAATRAWNGSTRNDGLTAGNGSSSAIPTSSDVDGKRSALNAKTQLQVGDSGTAAVPVSNGAQATAIADTDVGYNAGSKGTVRIGSTGTLSSRNVHAGNSASSEGTLRISDAGSPVIASAGLQVGICGTGAIAVSHEAKRNTGRTTRGANADGTGTVTLGNSGSIMAVAVAGDFVVGEAGIGKLSVLGGAPVEAGNVGVGERKESTVRVDGRADGLRSRPTTGGQIHVGDHGTGKATGSHGGASTTGGTAHAGQIASGLSDHGIEASLALKV